MYQVTSDQEKDSKGIIGWIGPFIRKCSSCSPRVEVTAGEEVLESWGHERQRKSGVQAWKGVQLCSAENQ
jgi:hypothetical protein